MNLSTLAGHTRRVLLLSITLYAGMLSASLSFASPPQQEQRPHQVTINAQGKKLLKDLGALRFERLGHPAVRWDHIPPVKASRETPHQLLVVLVRFSDLGFERFKDHPESNQRLATYYQELLFDPDYRRPDTLSHYFAAQSYNQYHLQGKVLPPITLDHPRAHYGRPKRPEGGSWRNDSDVEGLVEEVLGKVGAAHPELDWSNFDQWDPTDVDQDGVYEEPDGYLDHLVLVYAGGGQSSCQGLYKLHLKLNPNVGPDVFKTLNKRELECADRIWPHRFKVQRREGEGPSVKGQVVALGGAPITDQLWARDYNMQSEYTEASTFIHEFGHSIGLPDVYARQTNNSTGAWEVMSSTMSPSPQGLSAWSRIMLGWLKPHVIFPPQAGGASTVSTSLMTLDTPPKSQERSAESFDARALLVALPPQPKTIKLTSLKTEHGSTALYSGQGNELNRDVSLTLDLSVLKADTQVTLSMDAWWQIEAGWDFAYVEARPLKPGHRWRRLVDPKRMLAKHGHDGPKSLPGFTGRSGDLDGDGKNESASGCDPSAELAHGEDKKGVHPCERSTWSDARFDLSRYAGQHIIVRIRYFTDPAAVESGILIDNLKVSVAGQPRPLFTEDFEGELSSHVSLNGFLTSSGEHHFEVPHFYIVEHRDPYAGSADPASPRFRYDSALSRARPIFGYDFKRDAIGAVRWRARPGALLWYVNGQYAWSENEPTHNGPGKGFLLVVDANPNEYRLPGLEAYFRGDESQRDTRYDFKSADAQERLQEATLKTLCFVRSPWTYPRDLPRDQLFACLGSRLPELNIDGKTPMYSYEVINTLLPGSPRTPYLRVGELYDFRVRKGKTTWGLRNRAIRSLHILDAPFSSTTFTRGIEHLAVRDGELHVIHQQPHPVVSTFDDQQNWQNPYLRFGGVKVPSYGLMLNFKDRAGGTQVEAHWRSISRSAP